MTRVLERLIAPKSPIDMVRRRGAEEFHGTNMEESDKAEFWLEKLQRILEEVRCPPDQRVSCAVSLLQSEAYDWCKLALRSPRIPNPMTWESFVQEFRAKYVTEMYKESKWKQFLNLKQRNLSVAEYEKEFSRLASMHRSWSSLSVGNLRMDCMIPSRGFGTYDFSPTSGLLSVGPSYNENRETRNEQQRKISKEEVL